MDLINQYLKDTGIVEANTKNFSRGLYIKGDFSKAANLAHDVSNIEYHPTLFEKAFDEIVRPFTKVDKNSKYSFLFSNCSQVAMNFLSTGKLERSGKLLKDETLFRVEFNPSINYRTLLRYSEFEFLAKGTKKETYKRRISCGGAKMLARLY